MVQNIPFWGIMSPFKAEDTIFLCAPSYLNAYQHHSNFLILTNICPCKPLVKISDF